MVMRRASGANIIRGRPWWLRRCAISQWALFTIVMVAAVGLLVLVRLWASFVDHPSSLVLDGADSGVVSYVRPGSREWLIGVRDGNRFYAWPQAGVQVVTSPGAEVGVPDMWLPESLPEAMMVVILFLAAVASWRLLPGLARLLLVGAASVVVANLLGVIAAPLAFGVLLVPAMAMTPMAQSPDRWVKLLVALIITWSTLVAIIATVVPERFTWAELWRVAWMVPLVVAAVIVTIEGGLAVRRARAGGVGRSSMTALVASTSVGRQAIRAIVEEERGRHALLLHQQVLPPVVASLAALDAGLIAAPSTMLRSLASELRGDLKQGQLLVLRTGGLEAALTSAAAHLESAGLPCSVDFRAGDGRPSWEVEVAAWRIAQEALNNALRHSSATSVTVVATVSQSAVSIDVTDDGVGVPPETSTGPRHLGLMDMRERAREVGGRIDVLPLEPTGVRISCRWPG